ncbi:hypothetical protein DASC09_009860 [Saccharomycopsis crataegensis]|uniref:TRP C-terminal domain-containing protein n=1 Tax=Saccharomycopsis crataegensis TaxID=43959 RepID=A0AAV5QGD7_9ASCO|nr:hypothetical protein DASC09_009860 [Saccharomycopsis crataegensis]
MFRTVQSFQEVKNAEYLSDIYEKAQNNGCYYWVMVSLAYITIKSSIFGILQSNSKIHAIIVFAVKLIYLIALCDLRPYMDKRTNAFNILIHAFNLINSIFFLIFSELFGVKAAVIFISGMVLFVVNAHCATCINDLSEPWIQYLDFLSSESSITKKKKQYLDDEEDSAVVTNIDQIGTCMVLSQTPIGILSDSITYIFIRILDLKIINDKIHLRLEYTCTKSSNTLNTGGSMSSFSTLLALSD